MALYEFLNQRKLARNWELSFAPTEVTFDFFGD